MGGKSLFDHPCADSQCFVNIITCLIQFLVHFYAKRQRVVVTAAGPRPVVCWQRWRVDVREQPGPGRLAMLCRGAGNQIGHLHQEFLFYIDSVSYRVPGAITVFSLGLAPCWKCGFLWRAGVGCWGWGRLEGEAGLRKGQS